MNLTVVDTTSGSQFASRPKIKCATRPTILTVEDDAILAASIRRTLKQLEYEPVATVSTGGEAIDAAASLGPSLVLMNAHLPWPMDGIDTAKILRDRFAIPVVFLTAHSDERTLQRAMEVGAYGYVLKPFNARELDIAIRLAYQRRTLEARLEQRTALLEAILSAMGDAVLAVDPRGNVVLANEAAAEIGLDSSNGGQLLLPDQATPCHADAMPIVRALRGEVVRQAELLKRSPHESAGRWLSMNASPLMDAKGVVGGCVVVARDVTELKNTQLELARMTIVDELTSLYNRRGFQTLAQQQLKLVHRTGKAPAMVFVDINEMKWINDNLGHEEGDQALRDTAKVLKDSFRDSDIIARLGGDEFVVLAIDAADNAELLRARVHANVDKLNASRRSRYRLSLSIGVLAYNPADAESVDALIAKADRLMYEQKRLRRVHGSLSMRAIRGAQAASA